MNLRLRWIPFCFAALACALAAETTSLQIEQTIEPRFPGSFAFSAISTGQASVIINVDADGKLADLLVSGYTHKAFADEAVAALKQWRFTPAREDGKPVGTRAELKFDFSATARVVSLLPSDTIDAFLSRNGFAPAYLKRVCLPAELDEPVVPITSTSPGHPGKFSGATQPGSVLLDFYVDEYGQPRMPVAVKFTHRAFALAAVSALSQWRFTLPTHSGKPVAVRVRQEFIFPVEKT